MKRTLQVLTLTPLVFSTLLAVAYGSPAMGNPEPVANGLFGTGLLDRYAVTYAGLEAPILVTIKLKATSVCPSDDESESCEVIRVPGEMTGRCGAFENTVDVQGECGC